MKRVALFTPLSPGLTGIADYSEALVRLLAPHVSLSVFAEGGVPPVANLPDSVTCFDGIEYARVAREARFDAALYQIGNSTHHSGAYMAAQSHPGITILHELVLHHARLAHTVDSGDAFGYSRELAYANGYAGAMVASAAMRAELPYPCFEMPLCERVVDASQLVLVHSRFVLNRLHDLCPATPVRQIPMICPPIARLPDADLTARLRAKWGIPAGARVVAAFGSQDFQKRNVSLLDAVARLQAEIPGLLCLFIGTQVPWFDLRAHIVERDLASAVRQIGRVPLEEFFAAFDLAEVAVNLRCPTAGETSATAVQLLCRGVPLVVSDVGANAEIPDHVAIKIGTGESEVAQLTTALRAILSQPPLAQSLSAAARTYGAKEHADGQVVNAYLDAIESACSPDRQFRVRPE